MCEGAGAGGWGAEGSFSRRAGCAQSLGERTYAQNPPPPPLGGRGDEPGFGFAGTLKGVRGTLNSMSGANSFWPPAVSAKLRSTQPPPPMSCVLHAVFCNGPARRMGLLPCAHPPTLRHFPLPPAPFAAPACQQQKSAAGKAVASAPPTRPHTFAHSPAFPAAQLAQTPPSALPISHI